MPRIKIEDLPKKVAIAKKEMRNILGGGGRAALFAEDIAGGGVSEEEIMDGYARRARKRNNFFGMSAFRRWQRGSSAQAG